MKIYTVCHSQQSDQGLYFCHSQQSDQGLHCHSQQSDQGLHYLLFLERGGSVVECRTLEREVGGSKPTAAVLCPWARHFTPRKYWLITQEAVAPFRHDWKIVDWDVKPQHKQNLFAILSKKYYQGLQYLPFSDILSGSTLFVILNSLIRVYTVSHSQQSDQVYTIVILSLIRVNTIFHSQQSEQCLHYLHF